MKSDLDILAERVHEAPLHAVSGYVKGKKCIWSPIHFNGEGYHISSILHHRDKLSGKPTEFVNDWAKWRAQDASGRWYEYAEEPKVIERSEIWSSDIEEINCVGRGKVFGDWRDTLEKRPVKENYVYVDFTAKAEWDGEGVPPVGVVCEAKTRYSDGWFKCVLKAGYDSKLWIYDYVACKDVTVPAHDLEFRPIKSERERVIEEIQGVINRHGDFNLAAVLYDKFNITGKE